MNIKIFDKPRRYQPKETVSYKTNDAGEIQLVRTPVVQLPDPKSVANDFLEANKRKLPYFRIVHKYPNGIEINASSAVDFLEQIERAGFSFEADDAMKVSELCREIGKSEWEVMAVARKMSIKAKSSSSFLDASQAESLRQALRK